jgi:hypothetical protein
MESIIYKLLEAEKAVCDCRWCKDCPLSMPNLYKEKFNREFNIIGYENVLTVSTFCAKEILIYRNRDKGDRDLMKDWTNLPVNLKRLALEVSEMSKEEAYQYLLVKFKDEIKDLKDIYEKRVKEFREVEAKKKAELDESSYAFWIGE